ncbi:hypothetical protein ACJD0Z_17835 [Flavobacteriaceae bacterium M23B6Z8]
MRYYLTILFSFTLVTVMMLPSIINLMNEDTVTIFNFSEEEEKEEKQEKELEKDKILLETFSMTSLLSNSIVALSFENIPLKYRLLKTDIHLPPPELIT